MNLGLVVDDDNGGRKAMQELLVDEGYNVVTASDGRRAIEQIDNHEPSLLLTDLELPTIDGEQLLGYARVHHPTVPVILLTSRLALDARREAERLGAFGYLNKPIELVGLLDKVGTALAVGGASKAPGLATP